MSQKFKKIIAIALAAACLFTLAACTNNGDNGNEDKKFKVAYIMPGPSAYFAPMNKGADKAAEDYGIELVHTAAVFCYRHTVCRYDARHHLGKL